MSDTRNQHYVPQTYLRGFSNYVPGQERKAQVYTVDLERGRQFKTLVRNVGTVRDWNRVEADGVDPNYVEKALGEIESEWRPSVEYVQRTGKMDGEARDIILNFVALLSSRHPAMREQFSQFMDTVMRKVAKMSLATEERYHSQLKEAMEHGNLDYEERVPYSEMKRFIDSDAYTIETHQNFHMSLEFGAFERVLEYVDMREWSLTISPENGSHFVTSDKPVTLLPTKPGFTNVGHAHTNTAIVFPLTKNMLLIGKYDQVDDDILNANRHLVAAYNLISIRHAHTQVYAPDDTFQYRRDGVLYNGRDLAQDKKLVRLKRKIIAG